MGRWSRSATGSLNVVVVNPMVFRYMVNAPLKQDSVLGSKTIIVTANAGVPWNFVHRSASGDWKWLILAHSLRL